MRLSARMTKPHSGLASPNAQRRLLYSVNMLRHPLIATISVLSFLSCGPSSAQSPKEAEQLRKEIEALKASQAEMQKSLEEVRDFLKAATGGRFGGPALVGSSVGIDSAPANGRPSYNTRSGNWTGWGSA